MEQLKRQIGMAVRAARKRRRLTQEALAAEADISMETVSNLERAATLPSVDVLFKLARVLPLDLAALASAVTNEAGLSKERMRLESELAAITQALPDDQIAVLVDVATALARRA
jgi:transcriptional regulator with XRE-family HTH domain